MDTKREDDALAEALFGLIRAEAELTRIGTACNTGGASNGALEDAKGAYEEAVETYGAAVRDQVALANRETVLKGY